MFRRIGALSIAGLIAAACAVKTPDQGGPAASDNGESPEEVARAGAPSDEPAKPDAPNKPDDPCAACDSGQCLDDGTCVDCLPSNDTCGRRQYCTDDYVCADGCKDGSSCASGICGEDHSCQSCINDRECASGLVCSNGQCMAACSADQEGESAGCTDGLICCSLHCADLATDSKNCGACGNACGGGQFCGATCADSADGCATCQDTTLANVCSVAKVIVILDSNKNTSDGNRVPGRAMGAALAEQCPTQPKLNEAEQDSVEALNITTGRPVSNSSELLVVAGGPFYQNLEGYLEEQKISPLYWKVGTDATEFRSNKTNKVVVSLPIAGDHDSHDIFIIQFMRDPDSGSLILNAQGFWLSGTVAAADHLNNALLPDLKAQDQAWYAYEWTDKDGDKQPDTDEIELLASGNE